MTAKGPLSGITVIDLSRILAGKMPKSSVETEPPEGGPADEGPGEA